MSKISKSSKLFMNTFLFAVNAIGSRLMVFFLVPLYAHYMSNTDYGNADLLYSSVTILISLLTLKVASAVLRFSNNKSENDLVLTNAFSVVGLSSLVVLTGSLIVIPVMNLSRYYFFLPILFFCISCKDIIAQFCKSTGRNKVYAIDGVVSSGSLLLFSFLFLAVIDLNVYGYLIAHTISSVVSIVLLMVFGKVRVSFQGYSLNNNTMREMLRYSFPLVPNSLSWWIIQMSDRYMVKWFIGPASNGIYTMSYKIPSMVGVVADIFIQAWIISAMDEYDDERDYSSFELVYGAFEAVLVVISALLIAFNRPIGSVIYGDGFSQATLYAPFLIFALLFNNIQAFYSAFYSAAKETKSLLYSSITAAIINIVINLILIPTLGIYGAVIGTCVSYIVLALIRIAGSKKYAHFNIPYLKLVLNSILLLLQAALEVFISSMSIRVCSHIIICFVLVGMNIKRIGSLIKLMRPLLNNFISRRKRQKA